jgi:hypothetical protein
MSRNAPRAFFQFLAGLFLLSMCLLMLQIVQTRLLSVMAWYYLAFFAISMAMFGMTAGSLLVYFNANLFTPDRLLEHLSWIGSAFAISVAVSTFSLVSTVLLAEFGGIGILLWFKLILIILPPYVLGGMALCLALTRSPWPVGIAYGADLAGASAGCVLVLGLLSWMDGVSALLAVGAMGAVAAACFHAAWRSELNGVARARAVRSWLVLRHPVVLAVLLLAAAAGNAWLQPNALAPLVVKDQLEIIPPAAQQWNSFSRIRASAETIGPPAMWGASAHLPAIRVPQMLLNIDGSAGTVMYRFDGNLAAVNFLKYDVTNLAYAIRHEGRAAVIGVGGGRDVLSAHLFGFTDVTGVELNPIFISWLTTRFHDYDHLTDLPGTRLVVDEARSWFARTRERFDLIEMSLTDTWAATGAGAFSLSENGLYTVEGWCHFLDALTPGGVFTVSRWYSPHDIAETGRLLSLAAATLRARGVSDPQTHIFLAGTPDLATIIVGKAKLSAGDLEQLRGAAGALGFTELVGPGHAAASPVLGRILQARDWRETALLTDQYHLDLAAPTDDRPFFFNQLVPTDVLSFIGARQAESGVMRGNLAAAKTIANIVLLSAVLVLFTITLPSLPSLQQTRASLACLGTLYFALIGIGFMFIEIGIIQRVSLFLGHPVYGLSIGLFSMMLSTGLGSLLSERVQPHGAPGLIAWGTALSLFAVTLTFCFAPLTNVFEGRGLPVRILVTLVVIVPSGLLMGFGFPIGMRLVNAIDCRATPWFLATNGAAGVLAASAAVATSIAFSINASICIGAASYMLVGLVGAFLNRLVKQPARLSCPRN